MRVNDQIVEEWPCDGNHAFTETRKRLDQALVELRDNEDPAVLLQFACSVADHVIALGPDAMTPCAIPSRHTAVLAPDHGPNVYVRLIPVFLFPLEMPFISCLFLDNHVDSL